MIKAAPPSGARVDSALGLVAHRDGPGIAAPTGICIRRFATEARGIRRNESPDSQEYP
jgi:hypothetical protein